MNNLSSPADAIIDLPEWQGAAWTELAGGLSNRAWLLEKDGRSAVLKIDDVPRTEPYNTRQEEAAVQSAAAKAGLANRVLFADERVYLTEYVDGAGWDPACLAQEGKIEQLASALRRLHSMPRTGRTFDAHGAAKLYAQSIENPDREIISVCVGIARKAQLPNFLCCCHNDLVAENMITTPALKFLDWEYACDNDPMFDLATLVEHHLLSDAIADRLLDVYFNGAGESWRAKLAEQRRLYLALHWLWLAARPDSPDRSLKRLADRLTTSCS